MRTPLTGDDRKRFLKAAERELREREVKWAAFRAKHANDYGVRMFRAADAAFWNSSGPVAVTAGEPK